MYTDWTENWYNLDMESYIKEITELHGISLMGSIEEIQGGVVGRVYRILDKNKPSLIFKLNKEENKDIKNYDEIVYGSNPDSFNESYEILKSNNVPVPEVFAFGITDDNKFSYIIMQELVGDSDDYSEAWFKEIGQWLGKLHSIEKPYENSWIELFKKSLFYRFNNLQGFLEKDVSEKVEAYIHTHINNLTPAENFCFSHLDGFQGILKKQDDLWELLGVIDIEDHQYTDQRFVLAGFELNNEMKRGIVSQVFWNEYQKHKSIDVTFENTKNIFKIYYLLVWCFVFRNNIEKFKENISFLSGLVNKG